MDNIGFDSRTSFGFKLSQEYEIAKAQQRDSKVEADSVIEPNLISEFPERLDSQPFSPITKANSSEYISPLSKPHPVKEEDEPVTVNIVDEETGFVPDKVSSDVAHSKLNYMIRRVYDDIARGDEIPVNTHLEKIVRKNDFFLETLQKESNSKVDKIRQRLTYFPVRNSIKPFTKPKSERQSFSKIMSNIERTRLLRSNTKSGKSNYLRTVI